MDIMDMNVVFRQAAGLLNYLGVERPTPDSWGVASSAGIIQIAETYPIDGTPTATPRRDLRAGDQTGVVSALDDDVVRLVISWSDDLRLANRDVSRRRRRRARPRGEHHASKRRLVVGRLSLPPRVTALSISFQF